MAVQTLSTLRKLTVSDDEPIEDVVKRAAAAFSGVAGTATVELRLIDGSGTKARTSYAVQLTPSGASVQAGSAEKPDFAAITTPEVFRRIAGGTYSPFQAFMDRKLKIHGDAEIGRQIIGQLSPDGGPATNSNPVLLNESYNPLGPDGGSLTLSGCGFTPLGLVSFYYNYGSGQYEAQLRADNNGQIRNYTQPGLVCGDIPGHPGVGVIVTATDITTGKETTQNYATPC
jgi:putative sterol carrier protein